MTAYRKLNAWKAIVVVVFTISLLSALAVNAELLPQNEKFHIVFLISEDPDNYEATRTIPVFADLIKREHGFKVTVLLGEGDRAAFRFPGLEVLSQADLLVVFCRRVALSHEQLNMIKNYLKQGKPVVGIRTANHAFSVRGEISNGYEAWPEFVSDILGCENRGYGPQELGTDVAIVPSAKDNPILKGFEPAQWHSPGSLYLVAPLLDKEAIVLVTGKVQEKFEPIAWTRSTADKSRVFYTSLGFPSNFGTSQFHNLLVNGIYWALNLKAP